MLLDTGPLVAYLNSKDSCNEFVTSRLNQISAQFYTSAAVITETMYFLRRHIDGPKRLVEFLESTGTEILDCAQLLDVKQATKLMRQYANVPMDFADATLVLIADKLGLTEVASLDRRGFAVYRTPSGKKFDLILDRRSV